MAAFLFRGIDQMTPATTELPHICPTHPDQQLTLVLRGGAGFCARCDRYVQSANHPQPTLDPDFAEKREAAMAAERKAKTNARAKARRAKAKDHRTSA
jgi:hypothetical protein